MWGKLQILWGKCRFYRKTGCKIEQMEGNLFWWRMIFRNKIPNRVRNDTVTIFGITVLQYSEWRIFLILKHNMLREWLGWRIRKKNDTRLKMSKDISIFNLGRKNWGYTNKCIPSFIVKIVFLFSFFHYKTYIDCFKCIFNAIVYCVYSGCIC